MPTANGSAPTEKVPQGELGTVFDRESVFTAWSDKDYLTTDTKIEVRQIENMLELDGKARTLEAVLTLPLRSAPWSIEESEGDSGEAEFIRDALTREANAGGMSTPLDLVIAQATGACLFRRTFFERVFTIRDGRVVYDKIAFRPPGSCSVAFDKHTGAFRGFKQYVGSEHPRADEQGRIHVRPDRALVFIHGQHRKPLDGVSDLSTAYRIFETKQKIRYLWAQYLEEQVTPKTVAKAANGQHTALAQKVATLKGGGVIGIDAEQTVETLESSGEGASEFQHAMRYLDSEMAGSVLAGFTGLTDAASSGKGSYALSKDSTDLFLQSRQAVLTDTLAMPLTNFAIGDLVRWNFGVRAAVPKLKFGPMVAENVEQALELLKSMTSGSQAWGSVFPAEFVEMLIELVGRNFGMDPDRLAAMFKPREGESQREGLTRGVGVISQWIRETPGIGAAA